MNAKFTNSTVKPRASVQRRYGRSISVRAPGAFMNTLTRKAERAGGGRHIIEVRALKTSQYDHTTHDFVKKPLSERWHVFRDGRGRVQRDVYSAFLALHAQGNTHNPSGLDLAWEELASSLLRAGLCALKPQAVPSGTHAGSSPDVGVVRSKFLKPRPEQLTPSDAPRGLSGTPGLKPGEDVSPLLSHSYFGRETIDGELCDVFCSPAESFDGEPVTHFFAIPSRDEMRLDCTIHSKDVPLDVSADSVAWETFPEVLSC